MEKETSTLLLEKEVKVEEKLEQAKRKINLASIKQATSTEKEQKKNIVIETPNYDLMPELSSEKKKRVIKLERAVEKQKPKKKVSWVRRGILALGLAVTLALGIFTAVDLADSISAYNAAQSEYSVNVASLMQKIASVDSGNKTAELIETFPDELVRPSDFEKQSNWFDRFCNFMSGLFGGR